MPIALTSGQKRYLRGLAHGLKPVIQVGAKGVTEGLVAETDSALGIHELLKVKVAAEDRDARDLAIATLAEASGAAIVTRVGNVAVLYRPHPDRPLVALPR